MKPFYNKLVDLYAGNELPTELKDELESAAFNDRELSHDMSTLSATVRLLHEMERPEMTEESFQRILFKMYSEEPNIRLPKSDQSEYQLRLPIGG